MSDVDADANNSEEEILRKKLKPDPTVDQVLDAVRSHFYDGKQQQDDGPDIRLVKELDSYDDRNLWITVNGTNFLAKVYNGVESRDLIQHLGDDIESETGDYHKSAIHLQHSIMAHLNDCGIITNEPQTPTTTLAISTSIAIVSLPVHSKEDSPTPLVLRLLGWVPGRPMSSYKMLPIESLADAGRFLGNLGIALRSLPDADQLEAAKRYHQWDGKNTADLRDFCQYVTNDRRRSIVESVIDAFQHDIIDSKEVVFETSLIHADFNDANFLLDEDCCVSGVIDFGDSVESWTILDLSIAMAYSMLNVFGKHNRSLSASAAVLRGYHSVKPLTNEERQHLPLLIACRLSCSATLGAYSYSQNPGNDYLLLHATPAWNALELIWGTDPTRRVSILKTIHELYDLACSSNTSTCEKTGVIDCSDLNFPDPSVSDPLAASRSLYNE